MKLNFGKRLLMFVHWLLSLIGCVLAGMLCAFPQTVQTLFEKAYALIGKRTLDTIGIVTAAVYVLLTVGVAWIIFSGTKRRENRGFIVVDNSESGKTRIATSAVEQMIRQAMSGVEGIADTKSSITGYDDAISIAISVTIGQNAHVPTVTTNIQRAVRGYIEQNCGVSVREVCVSVKSVGRDNTGSKSFVGKRTTEAEAKPIADDYAPIAAEPVVEPVVENPEAVTEEEHNFETPVLTLDPMDADHPEESSTTEEE